MARKDWKKQLFRVKQIADQNFGRVEKTEALTANLQALEKTVDQYGKVFSSTGKKLLACLQTQPGQDIEKRQRKLPEYVLSNQLIENSQTLGIDTLIGLVFQISGDAEAQVANKTLELELGIEEKVLSPIHKLIENDIPAITKLKKNLQRVVLDMDSAKTRYHAAQKEQTKAVTNNPQSSTTKVDNLREEYDEACYKVDQCRDQLATEMFTLASREAELSKILLELIKCQASYHKAVLDVLEKRIPQMEEQIQFSQHVPVFGKPIEEHLQRANRKIALVIEVCVKKLIAYGGLEEEGLFRIAGAANKIKKLKAAFDSEQQAGIDEENDVHVIAGTLKLYLRELPDPLMKSSLYSEWMKAAHMPADQRLQALAEVLAKLPKANSENLRFLIKFLHKMSEYQEVNKMSPSNLSIVMGPNLIWPQGENGPSVLTTSTQSLIVEAFISHCDYFFPGDVDFGQHIKDPIQEIVPPPTVGVRCESTTRPRPGRESVNKRHTISLTEPTLAMPLSASAMSNHSAGMSDSNPDKVMIRLDADAATLERNRPHISSRSSSDTEMHSNGRYGKSCGLTNDGDKMRVSDLTSDMHSSTQCLTGLNGPVKRSITPPSKVAPPRGMHSDVYNTVFALQSLGDGWPDYLNRVRTLWDSHIHQHTPGLSADGVSNSQDQKSSPVSPDEASPGDGIRAGQGTKSGMPSSEQLAFFTSAETNSGKPASVASGAKGETEKCQNH